MIDSHCHLFLEDFDEDRDAAFDRAREAGVDHFLLVGIDLPSSRQALAIAEAREDVSAALGFHPTSSEGLEDSDFATLEALLDRPDVVAIGETGLDYYWKKEAWEREAQATALRRHLALGRKHDLPVVIHCRDAWPDLLEILEAEPKGARGIMHCFSAGPDEMRRSLALDFEISFAGPLTYPRSEELREAARLAPVDRIHLETDCPYLPPQGHRGQRNEPALMPSLLAALAKLHDAKPAEMDRQTSANSRRLFALPGGE